MPGVRVPAEAQATVWATFLAQLWRWVAEHGDARVPVMTVVEVDGERYALGSRVKNARVYYHRGSLTAEQVAQLEALPGWAWDGYAGFSDAVWRTRTTALRAYAARHGSVAGLDDAIPALGAWLRRQRARTLTSAQYAELAAIPRALETPTAFLDDFLMALTQWLAASPHRDPSHLVRSTTVTVGTARVRLGMRAADWRAKYRRGELSDREIERLSAVPGWRWEMRPPGRRPRAIEQLSKK